MIQAGHPVPRGPAGAALALVLLLMTALMGLGVGVQAMARRQAVAARAGAGVLQARLAAESGIRWTLQNWPGSAAELGHWERTPALSGRVEPDGAWTVTVQRLDRELYMVESEGRHDGGVARARSATAVWVLEPGARLRAVPAVVSHGRGWLTTGGGAVDASPGTPPEVACPHHTSTLDSLYAVAEPAPVAPLDRARLAEAWTDAGALRPFDPRLPPDRPGLGWISMDSLLAVATDLSDPALAPAPCPTDVPCPAPSGVYTVPRGARLTTPVRGVLVVDGDLAVAGSAHLSGWVLVTGDIHVTDQARIAGRVLTGGRVRVDGGGRIHDDPCAALDALEWPGLRRPRSVPPSGVLGPVF